MSSEKRIKPLIMYPMDPLGGKIGGIQTYIKNFIKYAPADFEVHFVGVSSDEDNRPVGKWQAVEAFGKSINFLPLLHVRDENFKTKIPLSLKFTFALFRYKKKIVVDGSILEFHRIEPSMPVVKAAARKILFVHGNIADLYNQDTEVKWGRLPWLYFQLEKRLIHHMDKVFVVRQDGVDFYRERYPQMEDRFSFLPTWVDEEIFSPYDEEDRTARLRDFLREKGLPAESRLVLYVGRLEGQKDPVLLVDAFRLTSARMPEARLVVVGTGSLRSEMEQRVNLHGLQGKILFLGALAQDMVAELMRISDVFVMTSAFEGMPMCVLEAQGCGLPVVSTDVGEVGRVVRDGISGLITKDRNAPTIGEAVLKVLRQRENFTVGNCLKSVEEFTAKRVLSRLYQAHYELDG
jgi:glycosyltransferase involved in cell wall biosynthesis